ncbi:MAG: endopeptidase La [SAR324 cluster bacterium]|nr:endopeptidase La [SAR324 cluster bacterium]
MTELSTLRPVLLPMLPLREEVVFPTMTLPFFVGRKPSMEALDKALATDRQIFVITQKNSATETPGDDELFDVGTIGKVLQIMRLPNGTVKALFEAKQRAHILGTQLDHGSYMAQVEPIFDQIEDEDEFNALVLRAYIALEGYQKISKQKISEKKLESIKQTEASDLADSIAPLLEIDREQKKNILECLDPYLRLENVCRILEEELEVSKLESHLKSQVKDQISGNQKEDYLQDQLHSIQKELGQFDDSRTEVDELAKRIKETEMSKEAEELALKELKKLKMMSPMSSESNVVRNYLDWLVSMPWKNRTEDNFDLVTAQQRLDEDHYGLEKVKERIIEYIAVAHLKGTLKGPILCLIGPPGVGKTSLAKSIARALDRTFVRMSLGGIRDEAEIRGHRRTYIGALPGKIIQSIRKAKTNNPVLLMDEIDKVYQSPLSDPAAALLEVLDPEQNDTFMDHYLEVEYSLSEVLFVCTANSTENIPPPLLDRMEVIQVSGYTELEKHQIATRFLVPKQCETHGLTVDQLRFRNVAISEIIERYTREAGVRNLEREIGKICRKTVTQLVRKKSEKNIIVTPKIVNQLLGVPVFQHDSKEETSKVGITVGLGVTSMGGELLLVEASLMPGSGKLSLTGKLGDVMQESAQAAYSYVRANAAMLGLDDEIFSKSDLHIHLPEGAIPKDGPSAGLPLITSIVSAYTKIPVRHEVTMTGEITLRGRVTEIGGLKEKLLAAKRGRLETVLIPQDNEKDLIDIPDEIKKGLSIHSVENVEEALRFGLEHFPQAFKEDPSGEYGKETSQSEMVAGSL